MRRKILEKLGLLSSCSSGNATMLVALGMPMLIGGAGFGVDLAQWYMWKRELQFAVDQAALAGAWAKASDQTAVQVIWQARAQQEYDANLGMVAEFDGGADISLQNYSTGTLNSVVVEATATRELPFSALLTDGATTVAVRAQATWNSSANFQACMLALDESAAQAFKMGNSVNGSSTCGAGAISDSTTAMVETGNSAVPLGTVVSEGGVDANFSNNGTVYQNQEGLSDPYAELDPPSSAGQPSQSYPSTCPVANPGSTTYSADGSTRTHNTYKYYKGTNSNSWTLQTNYNGTGWIQDGWSPAGWPGVPFTGKAVTSSATVGIQAETASAQGQETKVTGNGGNSIWRVPYSSTQDQITAITETTIPASDGKVYLSPGVYSSLTIACTTVFSPGVYFIAGDLDFGNNQVVTGTGGVMFVLTGSAGNIHVNGNSSVTLTGISGNTLVNSYGYSADDAAKLAGMLIWDPNSTDAFTLNGNSTLHLSGIMYMPNRDATFNGSGVAGSAAGNCIMVATKTLLITGNFSLNNFCVSTGGSAMSIGGTTASVKLVG